MSMLPNPLAPGDTIAVMSPSRRITNDQVMRAWEIFEEWGLNVLRGPHLFSTDGYFAGTDEQRLDDFMTFLNDSSVKAVFCARGGYGATRYVDRIKWPDKNATPPKWIIGFSDVTAIHLSAAKHGLSTVHGLMPAQFGYEGVKDSLDSLRDLLFYHTFSFDLDSHNDLTRDGEVTAPIIGGNLSLVAESLGTQTAIDTRGKILMLEEVDEYLYKIDRMLNQMYRAGKFNELAGVIIGDFSDCQDTKIPFGRDIFGVLSRYFGDLGVPVASGLPVGHENLNLAIPLNVPVSMRVSSGKCSLRLGHQS